MRELLKASSLKEVNAYDRAGYSPLMYAVKSERADVELVRLLLDSGADLSQWSADAFSGGYKQQVLAICLGGGDPGKAALLIERGADVHYRNAIGYDALIDAVHGREILRDARLIELLKMLLAHGVALNGVTTYNESALRVLSRIGRFDAVGLLLDAGADESHQAWTPLIRAAALGSLADVEREIDGGAWLEETDYWSRTAWLVAIQTGEIDKAQLLLERGAEPDARGRCGKPSSFYAIENYRAPMLRWLMENGVSVEQTDEFGATALMAAVECGNAEAVEILLQAGAAVDAKRNERTALASAGTRELVARLLDAGADPAQLSSQGRRTLMGLDAETDEALLVASPEEFLRGRSPRFGTANPEKIVEPFWEAMIRAGIGAYHADTLYPGLDSVHPVWCAERFGQSVTLLPDGRIVLIGGEHEDSYDEDFCIYNDVFVCHPDGRIEIYGYPEGVFPPTDFHTSTLIDGQIYIIGSAGYQGTRRFGMTPVYRLDTSSYRIEAVTVKGEAPGWIYGHRAVCISPQEIRISGGTLLAWNGKKEVHAGNEAEFILDTKRLMWRPAV